MDAWVESLCTGRGRSDAGMPLNMSEYGRDGVRSLCNIATTKIEQLLRDQRHAEARRLATRLAWTEKGRGNAGYAQPRLIALSERLRRDVERVVQTDVFSRRRTRATLERVRKAYVHALVHAPDDVGGSDLLAKVGPLGPDPDPLEIRLREGIAAIPSREEISRREDAVELPNRDDSESGMASECTHNQSALQADPPLAGLPFWASTTELRARASDVEAVLRRRNLSCESILEGAAACCSQRVAPSAGIQVLRMEISAAGTQPRNEQLAVWVRVGDRTGFMCLLHGIDAALEERNAIFPKFRPIHDGGAANTPQAWITWYPPASPPLNGIVTPGRGANWFRAPATDIGFLALGSAKHKQARMGGVPRDPEGPAYYTLGQPLKQPYSLQVELLLQAMTKLSTGSRLLLRWADSDADVPTPRVSWATFLAFVESEEGTCSHVHYKCHGAAQPGPGSCGGALVTPEGALIGLHCGAKPEVSNPDDDHSSYPFPVEVAVSTLSILEGCATWELLPDWRRDPMGDRKQHQQQQQQQQQQQEEEEEDEQQQQQRQQQQEEEEEEELQQQQQKHRQQQQQQQQRAQQQQQHDTERPHQEAAPKRQRQQYHTQADRDTATTDEDDDDIFAVTKTQTRRRRR
eukprot:SAG31_NODE_3121_length_4653_cov_61.162934_4_plen_633_part_00